MFTGCEVVDLVCSRLRSLPYCYIYRAKMQGRSLRYSRKMAKTGYIMNGREREGEKSGNGKVREMCAVVIERCG